MKKLNWFGIVPPIYEDFSFLLPSKGEFLKWGPMDGYQRVSEDQIKINSSICGIRNSQISIQNFVYVNFSGEGGP